MTTRPTPAIALCLALASATHAHVVPIANTTCALDMALSAPDVDVTADVDPPAPGELVRGVYTPDGSAASSRVQLCDADPVMPANKCRSTAVARAFTVGATPGSITLPSPFPVQVLASGDLHADALPVTITVGGTPAVVPFELSTGFVLVGTTPELGAPIDSSGAFALVGTGQSAALPAPFASEPLLLRLSCTLAPVPDLDQFALAARATKVRGTLTATKAKLSIVVETEFSLPGDFANQPTILWLGPDGAALVETVATTAAAPRNRFQSGDGTLTISRLKSKTGFKYRLVLKSAIDHPDAYVSGEDQLALTSGGLIARSPVTLRAKRHGTRLVVREQ
jgi:hypothetical protein